MNKIKRNLFSFLILFCLAINSFGAVLPEDRVDVLFHSYDGGGATINGPSVLVRKGFGNSFSASANMYLDLVTSATIDVVASGASEYNEERTEYSLGLDYLRDKTIMSLSYTNSSENDYEAETYGFGISQDFFGDLTNISLGITFGRDEVGINQVTNGVSNVTFFDTATHRRFSLGVSQILTKNFLVAASFESVIDEGFLNNPYRQTRAVATANTTVSQPEYYPRTHNSDAFAIRGLYYLPYRASIRAEFRTFSDSWDIRAKSGELRYVHPLEEWGLTFEGKLRGYSQTQAEFYQDLFSNPNVCLRNCSDFPSEWVEFRARDKEMGEFSTSTIGFGVTYDLKPGTIPFFERSSLNFYLDHIQFDYADFHDASQTSSTVPAGTEPLYNFNANVIRLFFSAWY